MKNPYSNFIFLFLSSTPNSFNPDYIKTQPPGEKNIKEKPNFCNATAISRGCGHYVFFAYQWYFKNDFFLNKYKGKVKF